ncbi:hypothetical protein AC739_00405 [Planococcus glaciei]|uniref:DUF1538 domain-containing protein n=1 Tax=Planococcus glaciei TaxID=459472 RepID=A0A7H8Q7R2_9BACL|nr:DUF1538 domain-containing protein [Planococcus glaciei]MCP2034034.1 hypothetical protein [Planomicrobium sp. HSC-17F08]KOF12014.1 hypothetical protein AC739_00405 [Planococcus glaciei]MBX0314556.1 DUF1538 domain-containing protein [Planococcus glaciei]QDY45095.1 DUF1538 domain-containing protein [Planococcus glaciei]QKX49957.1 DUF1538 domain-containing protein [Planococcus glaciei]
MENVKDTFKEVAAAILPVTIVVIILQVALMRLPLEALLQFLVGVVFVSIGFFLFLLGVTAGLLPVGELIGKKLPKTKKSWLIIGTGFLLGLAVTIAEPDVRVLAKQIDQVSAGEISSGILVMAVALGLAIFVAAAMVRTIFSIPIHYMLIGGYVLVFALSMFVPDTFVSISFDAGGVTTGPMAVPFILALGVGVASVLRAPSASSSEGFGLIGLASIGPILAIMLLGVLFQ